MQDKLREKKFRIPILILFLVLMSVIICLFVGLVKGIEYQPNGPLDELTSYTANSFISMYGGQGDISSEIGKAKREQVLEAWAKGDLANRERILKEATLEQKGKIYSALPAEEINKLSEETKDSSIKSDILKAAYKDQFGKDIKIPGLPQDTKIKITKNKEGKTDSITLTDKAGGEVVLNKKVNSISQDSKGKGNLVVERSISGNKFQYYELSPGFSMKDNKDGITEILHPNLANPIQIGFGGGGYFEIGLKDGTFGGKSIQVSITDANPVDIKTWEDVKNSFINAPSIQMKGPNGEIYFVQPQGMNSGKAVFEIGSLSSGLSGTTVTEGRLRVLVASAGYDIKDSKTQTVDFSVSVATGKTFGFYDKAIDTEHGVIPSHPQGVLIGKNSNGYVVLANNENPGAENAITMYDLSGNYKNTIVSGNGLLEYYNSAGHKIITSQGDSVSQARQLTGGQSVVTSTKENTRVLTKSEEPIPRLDPSGKPAEYIKALNPGGNQCPDGKCNRFNNCGSQGCSSCGSQGCGLFRWKGR